MLAVGSTVALVSDADGEEVRTFAWSGTSLDAHVGEESARLAALDSEGALGVYENDGSRRVVAERSEGVADAVFLPGGERMATLASSGGIALWRIDGLGGEDLGRVRGAVTLAVSPGGRFLLAANQEHVWVWELASGRRIGRLPAGTGRLADRHFARGGDYVALLGGHGSVSVYALAVDELLRLGRRQARRPFTADDFRRFGLSVPASYR